ncbi:MAG: transglycosylase domain-containing protein [Bdellovibrionales bacterium]
MAFLLFPLSVLGLILVGVAFFFLTLPDVRELKGCMTTSMYQVKLCPGDGRYTPLSQIAPELVDAVVASEDASFFFHHGFDWHEIQESFSTNLRQIGFKRGGSTLTQQLAKNVFLTKEKSLLRKVREAALTVALEKNFSKKELIERYLNVVEFGPNIYGVRAAAQYYFGKAPSQLHVLDAAFLAFLLPNPKGYSKSFQQKTLTPFAQKMVRQIVRRLGGFKKISPQVMNMALANVDQFPWSHLSRGSFIDDFAPTETEPSSEQIEQVQQMMEEESPAPNENAAPDPSEAADPDESSTWD